MGFLSTFHLQPIPIYKLPTILGSEVFDEISKVSEWFIESSKYLDVLLFYCYGLWDRNEYEKNDECNMVSKILMCKITLFSSFYNPSDYLMI